MTIKTIRNENIECTRCHRVLPIKEFGKEFVLKNKPHPVCRICKKKQLKALALRWEKERALRKDFPKEKECKECHRILPVSEYFNNMHFKDGRNSNCKRCMKKKSQALKQRWKEQRAHTELPVEKLCLHCYQTFPITSFCQTVNTKDGFDSLCKNCLKKRRGEYKERWIQDRQKTPPKTKKTCPGCKRTLSASAFYLVVGLKDGFDVYCKECNHRMQKEYAEKWEQQRASHQQIITTKTCNLCHRTLPISQFYQYRRTKIGYSASCISCENKRSQQYMQQWKEQPTITLKEKQCRACKRILPLDQFRKNKRKKDGVDYVCKACSKTLLDEYSKRWSEERTKQNSDFTLFPTFEKACSVCNRTLPLTMFYTRKYSQDGHSSSCKECDLKRMNVYLKKQKTRPKIVPTEKVCSACNRRLPASEFNKSLHRPDGLDIHCKSCHNKKHKAYITKPEVREKIKEWNRKNLQRPEVREKTRKRAREYAQRPDRREKRIAYTKKHRAKPEVQRQRQQYSKEYYLRKKKMKEQRSI